MNKYTLHFNNIQLEQLYQKREIPPLKNWTQKMAGVVCLIALVTIIITVFSSADSPKPYISQFLLLGSAFVTIILLQVKKRYFNMIHTINCSIYMCTMIWTYVDKDFYRNVEQDYLNGYIQGLATYVYITGTRFLPKLYLITLLFINMAFCSGSDKFFAQFMQVSPLWLIFIYKVYVDERTNRQLFLSQQQEHVYKYIIQNVMPNGLYLVKFDKKMERIELHSSNQKPKLLSYVKNTDDMKHLLKNTILANDDVKLQNLIKSNAISWSDTLDGHLRRKIDQALEWGEKRFIKLKDRNVIRSKQGTSSNDSDNGQFSICNNSNLNIENARSLTKNTVVNTEQDVQNNQNNQQTSNLQSQFYQRKRNQDTTTQILSNNQITIQPSGNNLQNQSPLIDIKNARAKLRTYNTQSTSHNFHNNFYQDVTKDNSNSSAQALKQQNLNVQIKFNQRIITTHSQQLISVQEVASNLLGNSSNLNTMNNQQNNQFKRVLKEAQNSPHKSSLTQRNVAAAANQSILDKRVTLNEENQNTYTDLVEYFSAIYKKNDDTQYKLNLRLSTFYLNEIYGVISVEDESFKEKFLMKERAYNNLQEIYIKTIKEINNLVVSYLYKMMRQNNLSSIPIENETKTSSESMYQMLRLKNKLDNYNHVLQILSSKYPKKIQLSECSEFGLINELKPFFTVCQAKAKLSQIKIFIDYSSQITENDFLFTSKPLLNHLIFNIIFNAIENTPSKGFIAIRIDSFDNNRQIKFKIFNTTTNHIDLQLFQNFHEPITIQALINDIKYCDRPQIGLRLAHRILQKIGPSSKIEYTTNGNNNLSDSLNTGNAYNNSELDYNNYQSNIQLCTLYQTFYVYRDMQSILQNNNQNQINKSTINDNGKSQLGTLGQSQLQKNTPYLLETKSNVRNMLKKDTYISSIPLDKSSAFPHMNLTLNPQDNQDSGYPAYLKAFNTISPPHYNINSSDIVIDESNDSFKHWIKTKQYEEYNKSIPRMFNLKCNQSSTGNASEDQSERISQIPTQKSQV